MANIGFTNHGRDFNFFKKVSVTSTKFGVGSDGYQCDLFIDFPTQGIMFMNEGSGIVEVSFNGNSVHLELASGTPSAALTFDNRVVSKIFFRVKTGSTGPITVSVNAWATR